MLPLYPVTEKADALITKEVGGHVHKIRTKTPSGFPPPCIVRSGVKDPTDMNYVVIPLVKSYE